MCRSIPSMSIPSKGLRRLFDHVVMVGSLAVRDVQHVDLHQAEKRFT
jgi:hypothetical protein